MYCCSNFGTLRFFSSQWVDSTGGCGQIGLVIHFFPPSNKNLEQRVAETAIVYGTLMKYT